MRLHRDGAWGQLGSADGEGFGVSGPDASTERRVVQLRASLSAAGAFIGRGEEISAIGSALARSRLVVLTGPSGVGKTRLAREAAVANAARFRGDLHVVELAALSRAELVATAIAKALAIREQHARPPLDTLLARLGQRHMLLVLDNCEHVLREVATVAGALLRDCPRVSILATSQTALGLAGEHVVPVPPLEVPDPTASLPELSSSAAVSLFLNRATRTTPRFRVTPGAIPVVAEICRRLDGIPLAIELAATRVAVLTPQEIAARLDHRFTLLTGGAPQLPPRHRSLGTALEWSHDLLSHQERLLFRRLSVFSNGFTLDAVSSVCTDGRDDDLLASLAGLVARSLVHADTSGVEARYSMLESIRLYGAERLEGAGEAETFRRRHAHWCLALAERAARELTGPAQEVWLHRLDGDYDNLRAGLSCTIEQGRADESLRLAAALTLYWRIRGWWREGRGWLAAALDVDGGTDLRPRAAAEWGAGLLAIMMEDDAAAATHLDAALRMCRQVGDVQLEGRVMLLKGNSIRGKDWQETLELYGKAARLARLADDGWCLGHALGLAGRILQARGDVAAARPFLEECLTVAHRTGDQQTLRFAMLFSGLLSLTEGDFSAAERLLARGLEVSRQLDEPYMVALTMSAQGELAEGRGRYDEARELLAAAHALNRESGIPQYIYETLCRQGTLAYRLRRFDSARELFTEAAALAESNSFPLPRALLGLAELAIAEDRWHEAEPLLDRIDEPEGHSPLYAPVTWARAALARAQGNIHRAIGLGCDALTLRHRSGVGPDLTHYLEVLAGLQAEVGRHHRGARLMGAAAAVRERRGFARPPVEQPAYEADLQALREGCQGDDFERLWAAGRGMSMSAAIADVLRSRALKVHSSQSGWGSLSAAERRVVRLVAEQLTNAEISQRLFLSPKTVESHLTRAFAKLNIRSRRELGREAARRRL